MISIVPSAPRQLQAAFDTLHEQGQGVWRLEFCSKWDLARIYREAQANNNMASREEADLVECASASVEAIVNAPSGQERLCLLCGTTFHFPDRLFEVMVLLKPHHPEPSGGVSQLICEECAESRDTRTLRADTVEALKSLMDLQDLRCFTVSSAGGHA